MHVLNKIRIFEKDQTHQEGGEYSGRCAAVNVLPQFFLIQSKSLQEYWEKLKYMK